LEIQVIVGTVVTRSPNSNIASIAMRDFNLALTLFEQTAAQSQRAKVALVSLNRSDRNDGIYPIHRVSSRSSKKKRTGCTRDSHAVSPALRLPSIRSMISRTISPSLADKCVCLTEKERIPTSGHPRCLAADKPLVLRRKRLRAISTCRRHPRRRVGCWGLGWGFRMYILR